MNQQDLRNQLPIVGNGNSQEMEDRFYKEELQLAFRNRGMPLEAMRYDITPTGLYYLLIHFDIPEVDATRWSLQIGGLVERPLRLSLDDIKQRPARTLTVTMECGGNGRALLHPRLVSQPWLNDAIGTANWTGTPLKAILDEAGLDSNAVEILFTAADQGVQGGEIQYYQRSLSIEEAMMDDVLLVYEMNGAPLEPQHGYPLRLVVPGWYGMTSVKWLESIEAIKEPFLGYQMIRTYRYTQSADDLGEPVSLMRVRALMVPPGVPDFLTRTRLVEAGPITIKGRAWAGRKSISRVEFSADGGRTWVDAHLDMELGPYAWRGWDCQWHATPGQHTLCVRATDSEENVQPLDEPWNYHGMGNNMAQMVNVIVQ